MEMSYLDRVLQLKKQRIEREIFDKLINEQVKIEKDKIEEKSRKGFLRDWKVWNSPEAEKLYDCLSEFDGYELTTSNSQVACKYQLSVKTIEAQDVIGVVLYRALKKTTSSILAIVTPALSCSLMAYYKDCKYHIRNSGVVKSFSTLDECMNYVVELISKY